jgi:hypothetical protein
VTGATRRETGFGGAERVTFLAVREVRRDTGRGLTGCREAGRTRGSAATRGRRKGPSARGSSASGTRTSSSTGASEGS